MSDTKPLLLGYLREHFLMSPTELAKARDQLTQFAVAEGFTLDAIYVERLETASTAAAFEAMAVRARREEIAAVVVPSHEHLEPWTSRGYQRADLENYFGASVLVASRTP